MSIKTPPIGMSGVFDLRAPFQASQSIVYTVRGHRAFSEIINDGQDPVETVYAKVGLGEEAFEEDSLIPGVLIVILVSDTGDRIAVPNTYINAYPNTAIVPHMWMVATVSLGVLPVTFDLHRVTQAITTAVSDYTGVESKVYMSSRKTHDVVTEERAVELEQIREAAIRYRSTDRADKLALQEEVVRLRDQVSYLVDLLAELEDQVP